MHSCAFTPVFVCSAAKCRDESRHGRHECPRHFVYPDWRVPPPTMIERRERAVFGWRFVFSWLRDEIGRYRVFEGGEQRGQFPLSG